MNTLYGFVCHLDSQGYRHYRNVTVIVIIYFQKENVNKDTILYNDINIYTWKWRQTDVLYILIISPYTIMTCMYNYLKHFI